MLPRFSTEIQLLIAEEASISSRASLSLCSHHTRAVVFPLLHHTVHIASAGELFDFCARVSEEEGADGGGCIDGLRVTAHVKNLRLDGKYEEDAFNELVAVVPHLRRLEGFAAPMNVDCLPQTVFVSMRIHCPRFDSVSLFLLHDFDASDEHLEATFALEGLKHLTIKSDLQIFLSDIRINNRLPPSILKALRASPTLETLHLAFDMMENRARWDVHNFFAKLGGMHFPRLRALSLRQSAVLDCWKLCNADDPVLQFLHAHHAQLETLALPCPIEDFAYGPAALRLPAHFFPALTAFEGPGFLCRRLSELPHPAARLRKLTVLLDRSVWDGIATTSDDEQAQLLDTLRAYSALEALEIRPIADMACTPAQLRVLAQAAPRLTDLITSVDLAENNADFDDLGPVLASFAHLQTLGMPVAGLLEGTPSTPEEFILSLAAHCLHLRTVIDLDPPMRRDVHWEAHVSRLDGVVSVQVETRIASKFDRYTWDN
ncbi:hypothetical protein C8J57DRAFT_1725918 [Mycena rebaudengoi]|nr:hypothetical protein C8J57DRAFT_1725918 [Mycena rebaudengoi]